MGDENADKEVRVTLTESAGTAAGPDPAPAPQAAVSADLDAVVAVLRRRGRLGAGHRARLAAGLVREHLVTIGSGAGPRRPARNLASTARATDTRRRMLGKLRVRGFKSLVDVQMDLGRFNVLVGENGAGKTNLLEAIGVAGCAASGRVDDAAFKRQGVRPGLPALFKTAFRGQRIRRVITLDVTSGLDAKYSVSLENPVRDPETAWRITNEKFVNRRRIVGSRSPRGGSVRGAGSDLDLSPYRGLGPVVSATQGGEPIQALLEGLTSYGIYTPFTPMLRGTVPDPSARNPLGLAGGGLADATLDLLRHHRERKPALRESVFALIDWASSAQVGSAAAAQLSPAVATTRNVLRFRDRRMRDKRDWISAFDASEGALYVMFLVLLVLHPEAPPVFAVDNIDTALNPRLARGLLRHVLQLVTADPSLPQILMTTHSPSSLDALPLGNDDVRLFAVDRARSGTTVVRRVQHDDALRKAEAEGRTLSQLWLSGALGGMPNI